MSERYVDVVMRIELPRKTVAVFPNPCGGLTPLDEWTPNVSATGPLRVLAGRPHPARHFILGMRRELRALREEMVACWNTEPLL